MLIRADGAPGKIQSGQIPGRLSRISEGKEKGILVDFVDGFDPWAARRAVLRLQSYRKKGWTILRK